MCVPKTHTDSACEFLIGQSGDVCVCVFLQSVNETEREAGGAFAN